jgi:hypothetical protein
MRVHFRRNLFTESLPRNERQFWLRYSGFPASCHIMISTKIIGFIFIDSTYHYTVKSIRSIKYHLLIGKNGKNFGRPFSWLLEPEQLSRYSYGRRTGRPGFDYRQWQGNLTSTVSRQALGNTQLPVQ